jgi:hypothetical protein
MCPLIKHLKDQGKEPFAAALGRTWQRFIATSYNDF